MPQQALSVLPRVQGQALRYEAAVHNRNAPGQPKCGAAVGGAAEQDERQVSRVFAMSKSALEK